MVGDNGVELGDAEGELDEVVTEGLDGVVVGRLRLDACGRGPGETIDFKRDVITAADLPVNLGEEDVLLAQARHRAEHAAKASETAGVVARGDGVVGRVVGGVEIGGQGADRGVDGAGCGGAGAAADLAGGQGRVRRGEEGRRAGGDAGAGEDALEAVTSKEEEQLVLDNGSADGAAELLAFVLWLEDVGDEGTRGILRGDGGEWVLRSPLRVAVAIVQVPVKLVRAALGNGVDHAAHRSSVFSGVVAGVHLELLDGTLGG